MTTETLSPAEELVGEIKRRSHWRVLIEPHTYIRRFPDHKTARDAARSAVVHLRGWDFPHFADRDDERGGNRRFDDGWETWSQFLDLEAWRISMSGQFIHYLSLREDSEQRGFVANDRPFLNVVATIYQLTEVFKFASRLVETASFEPSLSVQIRLVGMRERHLIPGEPLAAMFQDYVCPKNEISLHRQVRPGDLVARAAPMAVDVARELFGWFDFEPVESVVADIQAGLLQRG